MDEANQLNSIKDDSNFTNTLNAVQTITATTITSSPQETPTTQAGRCESDAIHPRLLAKHQNEAVKCLSCGQIFITTSLDEIVLHYENVQHKEFYTICRYCGGHVHQYQYISEIRNYHSCSRCKGGKDE